VVALDLTGLPAGWSARFTGGGFTVDGVLAPSGAPATANPRPQRPGRRQGTARLTVQAKGTNGAMRST